MAAIKKQSLVDQIYQRLRENIITMQLPLGSHLNVNELQSQMGVSCTPIREAINRLQQEGLVVYENNVGARVLMLDEHDVREIQELAATLQVTAVRLALRQGDRQRMALEIREQIRRYEQALTPQEEVGAVHELVGVFYHNCGNKRLDNSMIAIQGQQLRDTGRTRPTLNGSIRVYSRMIRMPSSPPCGKTQSAPCPVSCAV